MVLIILSLIALSAGQTCGQFGESILIEGYIYRCNGEEVSESDYDSSDPNCSQIGNNVSGCMCPADYYGLTCEFSRSITCSVNVLDPSFANCPGGSEYNFDLRGFPECYYVDPTSDITFTVQAECETVDAGVYIDEQYLTYTNLTVDDLYQTYGPFVYTVDDGTLISSNTLAGEAGLHFVNFNKLSDQTGRIVVPATLEQLSGNANITFTLNLNSINNYKVAGRYYFDVFVRETNRVSSRYEAFRGALDEIGYKEPEADKSLTTAEIVGIVFGVTIFAALTASISFYFYRKRKYKKLD